jgi:hypothetical protein
MRFLQACASSQRAVGADAAVDDSTLLTAAGCEEQARARRRASSVFVKACSKQPLGCVFNGAFSSLFDFSLLCCVAL